MPQLCRLGFSSSNGSLRPKHAQCAVCSPSKTATSKRPGQQVVVCRSSDDSSSVTGTQATVVVSNPEPSASASAAGSSSSSNADKSALLARIARAKAYRQQAPDAVDGTAATAARDIPTSTTTTTTSSSSDTAGGSSTSQITEEQKEALRQEYIRQLQQAQAQAASQGSAYTAYLQQQQAQQSADSLSDSGFSNLDQADPAKPSARPPPARPDFYTSPDAPDVMQLLTAAPMKAGAGSADEAADWLKGVLQQQQQQQQEQEGGQLLSPAMRPEEFTAAKEAAVKRRGAEIITAFPEEFEQAPAAAPAAASDTAASSGAAAAAAETPAGAEDGAYKPKVTTWGVFPRPQNISQAYGGGRNIRPGQALETPEQKQQREAEYAAALQRYKKAVFTDALSETELAAAQATFNEGMLLFKRGAISDALLRFDEVREKVPLKSKLGGLSTLQAAVCYDTLGNGRQAEALYKRIQGHPTSEVSRKAKQLVFGFQAMTFLKTQNLNYAVKKEDYLKYFRRSADRNRLYVASEEELAADQVEAQKAAAVAVGIVLGPVVIMGALLAGMQ